MSSIAWAQVTSRSGPRLWFELIREDDQAGSAEAGEDELGNAIGCDLVGFAYIDHRVTDGYPLSDATRRVRWRVNAHSPARKLGSFKDHWADTGFYILRIYPADSRWTYPRHVTLLATPIGFVESFNGRMRDELLSLGHARTLVADWIDDYNTERPHSSLGYATPRPSPLSSHRNGLLRSAQSKATLRSPLLHPRICATTTAGFWSKLDESRGVRSNLEAQFD